MSSKMLPPLLWLDLETTGLDPARREIVEVALVATDSALRVTHSYECILRSRRDWDEVARGMHERSGLARLVDNAQYEAAEMDVHLAWWVWSQTLQGRPMAGSSPHFDRAFCRAHLPETEKLFHYRNFDMSTLRMLEPRKKIASAHRSMADLTGDIKELRRRIS
jgi:oligoribonuclease